MYLQSIVKYQHLDKGSVWDNDGREKNTYPLCQYRGEDRVKKTNRKPEGSVSPFKGIYFTVHRALEVT